LVSTLCSPFEQKVKPFVEQAFEHATFFTRLHHFVLTSDTYIVAPGGLGTVLESMMIWQLLQVRHLQDLRSFSQVASNLTLLGQYTAANFHLASDGHGGTIVTDPLAIVRELVTG
jgi:predicted Rossmann-fold nucleotide-binding protein